METNMPKDLAEKNSQTSISLASTMDSSKVLNDGLSSEGASAMDSSKDSDTAPPVEEDVAGLPPQDHVLLNHGLEKEAFHANADRHPCGLLRQEIRAFLKQPISYVIKQACSKGHLPFLLLLALATFLRFYQFASLPAGLNLDEASNAYETYALLLHGTDRWGNPFPVYFSAWGSGQSALISYLNMPFVKFFGLTVFAYRFLNGILGVLTIVILYAFVKKWYGTRTALIAALLLATNPWHIMLSRWNLDCNMLSFFLLLGVVSLSYCYTSQYARILIPFSLIFLALAFYAYAISTVIIPIFLILYLGLVGLGTLWQNKLGVLLSLLIFLLIAFPFFLFMLDNFILHTTPSLVQHLPFTIPLMVGSRFAQVRAEGNPLALNAQFVLSGFKDRVEENMANGYSPLGLLSVPLASALGISPSSFGLLSVPLAPALGVYYSIRRRQVHANIFLIWLVATISIFCLSSLDINRANALFLPLIALSAIGISGLSHSINNKGTKIAVVSLVLAAVTLSNSMFCWYYFNNYNNDSKDPFNAGFDTALMHARSSALANEPTYVSDSIAITGHSYIYVLFFLKVDPVDFQNHSHVVISDGDYKVLYYRNYYFYPDETELASAPSFVALLKDNEQLSCGDRVILYSEGIWTVERCFNGFMKEVG